MEIRVAHTELARRDLELTHVAPQHICRAQERRRRACERVVPLRHRGGHAAQVAEPEEGEDEFPKFVVDSYLELLEKPRVASVFIPVSAF